MVFKIQKKLNKAVLQHVLPLLISLTGGNVCSRQMVLLDQNQHLLGEYFYNSWWLVLVDKRKFFGRYPQWKWSPLPSIKCSRFHLVYRYWNTYSIKKGRILDTKEDPQHPSTGSSVLWQSKELQTSRPYSSIGSLKNHNLGQMIQYLSVVVSCKMRRLGQMISKVSSSSIILWLTLLCKHRSAFPWT